MKMRFSVEFKNFGFTEKEILFRLKKLAANYQELSEKYKIEKFSIVWNEFRAVFSVKAMGFKKEIKGELEIKSGNIEVSADLPIIALAFKQLIKEKLCELLLLAVKRNE